MIAIIPVRGAQLPLGAEEAVAEAGGWALLLGLVDEATDTSEVSEATAALDGIADRVMAPPNAGTYGPARWAGQVAALVRRLAAKVDDGSLDVLILPASPDGRDLAPRLAHCLDRPLVAGAVAVHRSGATVARQGGLVMEDLAIDGPFVATLQPGVRGVERDATMTTAVAPVLLPDPDTASPAAADPALVELTPADPTTMDLSEAPRIVGGGAGLGSAETTEVLAGIAAGLGCSIGGTRVITDWGWLPFERQIGTTGVTVHPELYLAFGISGAVQHVAGLGSPQHIIAVNTDAACPMMAIADVAVVTDAPALVHELAARLAADRGAHALGADDA